jgi:hypothetical protein
MSEAESMSFYTQVSHVQNPQQLQLRKGKRTHPAFHLTPILLECLHKTALLIAYIPHPIRLARGTEDVPAPPIDPAEQLLLLVDVEFARIMDSAAIAIPQTLLPIHLGIRRRE